MTRAEQAIRSLVEDEDFELKDLVSDYDGNPILKLPRGREEVLVELGGELYTGTAQTLWDWLHDPYIWRFVIWVDGHLVTGMRGNVTDINDAGLSIKLLDQQGNYLRKTVQKSEPVIGLNSRTERGQRPPDAVALEFLPAGFRLSESEEEDFDTKDLVGEAVLMPDTAQAAELTAEALDGITKAIEAGPKLDWTKKESKGLWLKEWPGLLHKFSTDRVKLRYSPAGTFHAAYQYGGLIVIFVPPLTEMGPGYRLDLTRRTLEKLVHHELVHHAQWQRHQGKNKGTISRKGVAQDPAAYFNTKSELMARAHDYVLGLAGRVGGYSNGKILSRSEVIYRIRQPGDERGSLNLKYLTPKSRRRFFKYAYQYAQQLPESVEDDFETKDLETQDPTRLRMPVAFANVPEGFEFKKDDGQAVRKQGTGYTVGGEFHNLGNPKYWCYPVDWDLPTISSFGRKWYRTRQPLPPLSRALESVEDDFEIKDLELSEEELDLLAATEVADRLNRAGFKFTIDKNLHFMLDDRMHGREIRLGPTVQFILEPRKTNADRGESWVKMWTRIQYIPDYGEFYTVWKNHLQQVVGAENPIWIFGNNAYEITIPVGPSTQQKMVERLAEKIQESQPADRERLEKVYDKIYKLAEAHGQESEEDDFETKDLETSSDESLIVGHATEGQSPHDLALRVSMYGWQNPVLSEPGPDDPSWEVRFNYPRGAIPDNDPAQVDQAAWHVIELAAAMSFRGHIRVTRVQDADYDFVFRVEPLVQESEDDDDVDMKALFDDPPSEWRYVGTVQVDQDQGIERFVFRRHGIIDETLEMHLHEQAPGRWIVNFYVQGVGFLSRTEIHVNGLTQASHIARQQATDFFTENGYLTPITESQERETRRYKVTADPEHLDQIEQLFWWVNSTHSGHSGSAKIYVDGDGAARVGIEKEEGELKRPEEEVHSRCDGEAEFSVCLEDEEDDFEVKDLVPDPAYIQWDLVGTARHPQRVTRYYEHVSGNTMARFKLFKEHISDYTILYTLPHRNVLGEDRFQADSFEEAEQIAKNKASEFFLHYWANKGIPFESKAESPPAVKALAESDDGQLRVEFDAGPWLQAATVDQVKAALESADAVALDQRNHADLDRFFGQVSGGFKVYIDPQEIAHARPDVVIPA